MARLEMLIGSLTAAYTDTQYTTNTATPRVGDWFYDPATKAKYIFLKNSGSASIAASDYAVATTTMPATFTCKQGTGVAQEPFAGTRIVGATSLAQNEYGWLQCSGACTITADAAGTAAGKGITSSDATAGAIETQSSTYATSMCAVTIPGTARTTTTSAVAVCDICGNVWGV